MIARLKSLMHDTTTPTVLGSGAHATVRNTYLVSMAMIVLAPLDEHEIGDDLEVINSELAPLKTKRARRVIPLTTATAEALSSHLETAGPNELGLVFVSEQGTPQSTTWTFVSACGYLPSNEPDSVAA